MKNLIRTMAHKAGYLMVSKNHAGARYLTHWPVTPFGDVLLRAFSDLNRLNFIQVGANDGVRCDPIRHYVLNNNWSGILVEPSHTQFRALEGNYAAQRERLTFINAAVDAQSGTRALYQIPPNTPGLPDWGQGVISFNREHVEYVTRSLKIPNSVITETSVATVTWNELYQTFGNRRCDVLVIDVEGYDVMLLRLAHLKQLKPRVLQFEHGSIDRRERLDFYGELIDLGYEIVTDSIDTIAYLPKEIGATISAS